MWAEEDSAFEPVERQGNNQTRLNKDTVTERHHLVYTDRSSGLPVCWLLCGALSLARGGTPLYWGRRMGAWPLLWRWGSDVLSRGRNLWAVVVLVWGSCKPEKEEIMTITSLFCGFMAHKHIIWDHNTRENLAKGQVNANVAWIVSAGYVRLSIIYFMQLIQSSNI